MIDEIEKLEAIAKKSPDEPGAWPFYMASFNKLATPTAVLALIDRLKKAEAELAAMREQKPIGWLTGYGTGHGSGSLEEMASNYEFAKELCYKRNDEEMELQKDPEFYDPDWKPVEPIPVYASPIAAPVPATQPKAEISDARITEIAFDFYADSNDGDAINMVSFARAILAEAGKQE